MTENRKGMGTGVLLETKGLGKQFHGVYALRELDFSLREGEVCGLVGENGAGKSTLIKVLGGVYQRDEGRICWEGKELPLSFPPQAARDMGISIIYQDHTLVPGFTGLENLFLGRPYPSGKGLIRWKEMKTRAEERAKELGIQAALGKLAADMGPAEKTCVEILRAMMNDCRLLILDEPTASLSDKECRLLYELVGRLKEKGTAVLYVSHRLEEVLALTDRVMVLCNGRRKAVLNTRETEQKELIRLMSHEEQEDLPGRREIPEEKECRRRRDAAVQEESGVWRRDPDRKGPPERGTIRRQTGEGAQREPVPALEIRNLSSRDGSVKDASLSLRNGRITGLFGLCGSGRTELLECVYGCRMIRSGKVFYEGQAAGRITPAASLRRGVALICEDRRGKGLVTSFSLQDNMLLSSMDRLSRMGEYPRKRAGQTAEKMIRSLRIRCFSPSQPVAELSGGNQQKVVFARALLHEPRIWLCDEPTKAVDVAARREIHRLLRQEAVNGKAVLYVSSDLTEVLEVADEVAVMVRGTVRAVFENDGLTRERVLACCYEEERR